MVVMKRREDAEPEKRPATTPEGLTFDVTPYFGSTVANAGAPHPGLGVLHPVAVRIDQRPETVNAPHFHQANQFQVFVGGEGMVGKHPIDGVTIHYAQAYSPYGPLCSDRAGSVIRAAQQLGSDRAVHAGQTRPAQSRRPPSARGNERDARTGRRSARRRRVVRGRPGTAGRRFGGMALSRTRRCNVRRPRAGVGRRSILARARGCGSRRRDRAHTDVVPVRLAGRAAAHRRSGSERPRRFGPAVSALR